MISQHQLNIVRKCLRILSFYVLPLGLLGVSIMNGFDGHFLEELGEPALNILIFILFLTPLTQILDWKILKVLMTWRRAFGVASFWFFLFHAAGLIYVKRLTDISAYLDWRGYLFWGGIAGIGMLILGLTSNDLSVRFLRKNWKRIQLIAIPTLFFAQAHASMADERTIVPAVLLFAVYIVMRAIGVYMVNCRLSRKR